MSKLLAFFVPLSLDASFIPMRGMSVLSMAKVEHAVECKTTVVALITWANASAEAATSSLSSHSNWRHNSVYLWSNRLA